MVGGRRLSLRVLLTDGEVRVLSGRWVPARGDHCLTLGYDGSVSVVHERARWWSYGRQRLGRAAPDAERTLHDVVGVYSAHSTGPLSLRARVGSLDADSFRRLESGREVLRLPAMRTSIH